MLDFYGTNTVDEVLYSFNQLLLLLFANEQSESNLTLDNRWETKFSFQDLFQINEMTSNNVSVTVRNTLQKINPNIE